MEFIGMIDKVVLGTLLDVTITEMYEIDDTTFELYTERTRVGVMTLEDIIKLYQTALY